MLKHLFNSQSTSLYMARSAGGSGVMRVGRAVDLRGPSPDETPNGSLDIRILIPEKSYRTVHPKLIAVLQAMSARYFQLRFSGGEVYRATWQFRAGITAWERYAEVGDEIPIELTISIYGKPNFAARAWKRS